jgi:MFS family permease
VEIKVKDNNQLLRDSEPLSRPGEIVDSAPTAMRGWYIVALLCGLFTFSLVDRLVLGLLAVDVARDLNVSDSQLGLLIGTSFAIIYSVAGVPIAYFLDRGNRKWLIFAGVALWSMMTILSAFANNFATLAALRAGMALGEAVLTPGAISLIADMFPREKRVLPTTIYAAIGVLAAGGMMLGAAAFQLAQHLAPDFGMAAWRLTLILTGLPPLLIGLVFEATAREPVRGRFDDPSLTAEQHVSMAAFVAYLRQNWRFYLPLYLAVSIINTYLFGMLTWTPSLMIRAHGANAAEAGYMFGLLGMAVGVTGSIFWPRLAVVLGRRGWRDPLIFCLIAGPTFGTGFVAVGSSMPDTTLFLIGSGLGIFGFATTASLMPLVVQNYGPPRLRARLVSLMVLSQSLIGYGAGPYLVGKVAGFWPDNPMALGHALSLLAVICGPLTAIFYALSRWSLKVRPLA